MSRSPGVSEGAVGRRPHRGWREDEPSRRRAAGAGPGSLEVLGKCWAFRLRSLLKPAPSLTSTFLFGPVSSRQTDAHARSSRPRPVPSVPTTSEALTRTVAAPDPHGRNRVAGRPRDIPFLSCSLDSLCPCLGCSAAPTPVSQLGTLEHPLGR